MYFPARSELQIRPLYVYGINGITEYRAVVFLEDSKLCLQQKSGIDMARRPRLEYTTRRILK